MTSSSSGAGINGLTCAAYLSEAGKRVLVLEANPQAGGFTITEQTPGAPEGFKINTYAVEFPFADMKPSVVEELGLERFGLAVHPPGPEQHLHRPGRRAVLPLLRARRDVPVDRADLAQGRGGVAQPDDLHVLPGGRRHALPVRPPDAAEPSDPRGESSSTRPGTAGACCPPPGSCCRLPTRSWTSSRATRSAPGSAMNIVTGSFRPLDEIANTSILVYFAFNQHVPDPAAGRRVRRVHAGARRLHPVQRRRGPHLGSGRTRSWSRTGGRPASRCRAARRSRRRRSSARWTRPRCSPSCSSPPRSPPSMREEIDRMLVLSSNVSHFKVDLALSRRPTFPNHEVTDGMLAGLTFVPERRLRGAADGLDQARGARRGAALLHRAPVGPRPLARTRGQRGRERLGLHRRGPAEARRRKRLEGHQAGLLRALRRPRSRATRRDSASRSWARRSAAPTTSTPTGSTRAPRGPST